MANPETVKRAFFRVEGEKAEIEVHFNPESLQYTINNSMKNQGRGNKKKQYVSESTGKLVLDLIFDSTATGENIRLKTAQVAKFMEPKGKGKNATPPIVNFEWGLYKFKGMVESYQETIDFFSSDGVPLRASVNISMSSQDQVFEGGPAAKNAGTAGSAGLPSSAVPAPLDSDSGKGLNDLATKAGNPAAAKDLAKKNGIENMRFPGNSPLEIDESFSFKSPAAFASGSVGLNASAGGGLSLGGGLDVGAGLNAGAGAFAGLRATADSSASMNLSLDKFIDTDISGNLGIDASSIGLGGSAGLQGSASLKAEVGQAGQLKAKIEFDGG